MLIQECSGLEFRTNSFPGVKEFTHKAIALEFPIKVLLQIFVERNLQPVEDALFRWDSFPVVLAIFFPMQPIEESQVNFCKFK